MYSSISLGLFPADWMRIGCGISVGFRLPVFAFRVSGLGLRVFVLGIIFYRTSVTRRRDPRKLSADFQRELYRHHGHGCGVAGLPGVPGMWMGGVPGAPFTPGVPGISEPGVPGVPGVQQVPVSGGGGGGCGRGATA